MAIFDWRNSPADTGPETDAWTLDEWKFLTERYESVTLAVGRNAWTTFVSAIQNQGPDEVAGLHSALDILIAQLRTQPPPAQDTMFVSHQRKDAGSAEWVAWAATEAHFDYWLDVHDPKLTIANTLSPPVKSVLVAGIIEMALANCTHIVSLQTLNSQLSRWVPYEFGRAKERRLLATNAASWFQTGVAPDANGDYLSLAFCAVTRAALQAWLAKVGRTPPPYPNLRWPPHKATGTPLPN